MTQDTRATAGARPASTERGLEPGTARGVSTRGTAPPVPPTPLQSVTNPAIWVYRRDRFAFTTGAANGWETSYSFTTLRELVRALRDHDHATSRINKLGICAHGDVGGVVQISTATSLNAGNVDYPDINTLLTELSTFLTHDAQVIFFSCIAGQGVEGTALLNRLSRLWAGRTVIGFTTFGYIDTSFGAANAPGNIYDTGQTSQLMAESVAQLVMTGRRRIPRMNENNDSAKWSRNGSLIRTPSIDI